MRDLAFSFPALLFTVAVPPPGVDARRLSVAVVDGEPLKTLAAAAGLPLWSRNLMPEAFAAPLRGLPDGDSVSRQINNYLPRSRKAAAHWLSAVCHVNIWGTPTAALWVARELHRRPKCVKTRELNLLALYVWFSEAPDTYAGRLIRKSWHPDMSVATVLQDAREWLEELQLRVYLDGRASPNIWLDPGAHYGFEFHALTTAEQISDEAVAMQHCLRRYGNCCARDRKRLWSIRRDGVRVATLSVGRRFREPLLDITELRGRKNANVSTEVWWAALRWLHGHDLPNVTPDVSKSDAPMDRQNWLALWRPYWLAKKRLPAWLPLVPTADVLADLEE